MSTRQKFLCFVSIVGILILGMTCSAYCELTKQDVEEIRKIIREEIQHVDKKIDNLRIELRMEIKDVRAEIKDVRTEMKDVRTEMKDFMLWGFGTIFFGMLTLVGFVLWDRRSALAPAIRRQEILERKEDAIERALKDFAMKEPRFAEVLRVAGLL